MSTNLDCYFEERKPGEWYYGLQIDRCDDRRYELFGPFRTFAIAHHHLSENHANPGGFSVQALPGCKHQELYKPFPDNERRRLCQQCGDNVEVPV